MNLFGKKKQEQKKEAPPPVVPSDEIKEEATFFALTKQVSTIETQIADYTNKVDVLETQIKALISQKKKKEAMSQITEAKLYKENLITLERQKQTFVTMKIQIESAAINREAVWAMKIGNDYLKSQEKVSEQLEDAMGDWQEHFQNQEQLKGLWEQSANMGVDEDANEEAFAEYEKQVAEEEAMGFKNKMDSVPFASVDPAPNQISQPAVSNTNAPQKSSNPFAASMDLFAM